MALINEVHGVASHATLDGLGWPVHARRNAESAVTVAARVLCLCLSAGR